MNIMVDLPIGLERFISGFNILVVVHLRTNDAECTGRGRQEIIK